ncbi:MAG TPA: hypothetical protein PKZ52_04675 [Cellvibrionaceae bacterium]|nr:hypothetical protein [Cellvibrionaceae bacterium]
MKPLPFTKEPLKNVGGEALARRICQKKRSLHTVNEHFFGKFNDARASKVIFQRFPKSTRISRDYPNVNFRLDHTANKFMFGSSKIVLTPKFQRGDMLIEALIGLVLMAIVAVGVTTITSKVEKGKREMSVQDLAVSQLQELLVKNGNGSINLCDSTPETITLPDETITVAASGCTTVSATINGVAFTDLKQPIVLSATSSKNGAKYTVGGVSGQ